MATELVEGPGGPSVTLAPRVNVFTSIVDPFSNEPQDELEASRGDPLARVGPGRCDATWIHRVATASIFARVHPSRHSACVR